MSLGKALGNRAVMENTAGTKRQALDSSEIEHLRRLSMFPTPPWAARAGAEVIRDISPSIGLQACWECAAGAGHMVHGLKKYFRVVAASDVRDYGAGFHVLDFLCYPRSPRGDDRPDWVVTNPPFVHAQEFVERGLQIARVGVAMLCRLALLESVGRFDLMSRLTVLAPFSERVPIQLGSWDPDLSTATAYAWFVWLVDHRAPTVVRMIPPGTKARLTRPSDAAFANR